MIDELATLVPVTREMLWLGFVVFLRVSAMMFVVPGFGERSVPSRVKLGLAGAFTLIIAPAVASSIPPAPIALVAKIVVLAPEIVTGLFYGLMLRFFIFALQVAGSIAAQSTSLAQIFGGSAGADPQPAIGHLLVAAGLALAAMMGLHVQVAAYLLLSYEMIPPGIIISSELVARLGVAEVGNSFALGFQLSAPFVIASLIYNVILGVINRAMPQLLVSFVGAPAITAGGLFLMAVAVPIMLTIWFGVFSNFMMSPFEAR